jgi:FkbM family methyltransferase
MQPIYDIWRILDCPRDDVEAEIRALCQTAYIGDHSALCRILGRYKLYVDTRDIGIASHLMLDGFWELWVTAAMMRCVRRGAVVADIGANLGYFTLLLADLVGPEGRVLSFEPNPDMTNLLRKSISCNGFGGYTDLHEIALGAHEGHATLDVDEQYPGGGRSVARSEEHVVGNKPVMSSDAYYGKSQPTAWQHTQVSPLVRMTRFDAIVGALDVEFIKMDVEGCEQFVWSGMTKLLERKRPLTIFMEFTIDRFDDPSGFLDEIESHGFGVEIIDSLDGSKPVTRETLFAQSHAIDHMLAFRRDGDPQ